MISNGATGGTSNVRIIISVVIIVGCFTVIYPRFFHPVVLKVLGMAPEPPAKRQPDFPPQRGGGGPSEKAIPDDVKRHMRPGPHPGMRASAEMNNQKHTSSGRGGIMGMVLPMYAVGIVVYLIYTLFKVFNKEGKGDIRRRQQEEQQRRGLAHRGGAIGGGQPRDDTYPGSEATPLGDFYGETPEEKLANIEDVLNKAQDKNISEVQMQDLQRRLQETEAQMASILKAMNSVSTKVVEAAADDDGEEQVEKIIKEKDTKSSDSSPDISSYEVIDKSKGGKSKSSSPEVETLTAGETVKNEEGETAKTDGKEEKSEGNSEEKKEEDEAEIEEVLLEDKKEEEEEEGESSVRKRKTHPVSD